MSDAPEGVWARAWHLHSMAGESVEAERLTCTGTGAVTSSGMRSDSVSTGRDCRRARAALPPPASRQVSGPASSPVSRPLRPSRSRSTTRQRPTTTSCGSLHSPAEHAPINCQIRLTSNEAAPVTVVLRDPTGRLAFPSDPITTLTLPVSKAFVPFTISGQNPSAAIGDALIQARVGTAAGPIAGTRAVTVVSFGAAQIQLVQGGNYGFVGDLYTVPEAWRSRSTPRPRSGRRAWTAPFRRSPASGSASCRRPALSQSRRRGTRLPSRGWPPRHRARPSRYRPPSGRRSISIPPCRSP